MRVLRQLSYCPVNIVFLVSKIAFNAAIIKLFLLLKYIGDFFQLSHFFGLKLNRFLFFSEIKDSIFNIFSLLLETGCWPYFWPFEFILWLCLSEWNILEVIIVFIFFFKPISDVSFHYFRIPSKSIRCIFLPFFILEHGLYYPLDLPLARGQGWANVLALE